jgi:hypothetical protein
MRALDHFLLDPIVGSPIYDVDGLQNWWTAVKVVPGKPVGYIQFFDRDDQVRIPERRVIEPGDYTVVAEDFALIRGAPKHRRAFVGLYDMTEKTANEIAEAMIVLAAKHAPIIDLTDHWAGNLRRWFRDQDLSLNHLVTFGGMKIALAHPEFVGKHVIRGPQHGLLLHGGIARIAHLPTSWEHVLSADAEYE